MGGGVCRHVHVGFTTSIHAADMLGKGWEVQLWKFGACTAWTAGLANPEGRGPASGPFSQPPRWQISPAGVV